MLLNAVRMKAVNPENRVIDTIADAVSPVVWGKLNDPAQPESAQCSIVKGGGSSDVRDTDTRVIDHDDTPSLRRSTPEAREYPTSSGSTHSGSVLSHPCALSQNGRSLLRRAALCALDSEPLCFGRSGPSLK